MNGNGRNMYVFRDGRRAVCGPSLLEALAARVQQLSFLPIFLFSAAPAPATSLEASTRDLLIDVLLRSGELECALVDAQSPAAARLAMLTNWFARFLVGAVSVPSQVSFEQLQALLPQKVPPILHLSPPEGFAFYALHPLDFADMAERVPLPGQAAVVGIRSIGTTLSAIVTATLHKRGSCASRITVRPTGHPYDRRTQFTPEQLRWVAAQRASDAAFLVVDEGPGMSGSSFLSVGEALLGAGVARSRIDFLCSRHADLNALCAHDAAARWQGFRTLVASPATHIPQDATVYIGGGYWRHKLIGLDSARWPASWSQMERLKFLSSDRRHFFKFEGFSRFGTELRERAQRLQESGYSVAPVASTDGFGVYPVIEGSILTRTDLSSDVLRRMASYCAYRAREFRSGEVPNSEQMQVMVRFNAEEEFGIEWDRNFELAIERPVLVDGRMLPEEWVRLRDGAPVTEFHSRPELLKCDATSHGDDHFFPGPATDICWDLAGAIVEWDMPADARRLLVECYRTLSGDNPFPRLQAYLLAYAVFRMAYCKMAAAAMHLSEEEARLLHAYRYYRTHACALLSPELPMAAD